MARLSCVLLLSYPHRDGQAELCVVTELPTQGLPRLSCVLLLSYPRRDGQAELCVVTELPTQGWPG